MNAGAATLPSQGLQGELALRLARHGGWVEGAVLLGGLALSAEHAQDELAALVEAGTALFNPRGALYRLAGEALARRALKQLLEARAAQGEGPQALRVRALGMQSADGQRYRVGLARCNEGPRYVMAELEFDYPAGQPQVLTDGLMRLLNHEQ